MFLRKLTVIAVPLLLLLGLNILLPVISGLGFAYWVIAGLLLGLALALLLPLSGATRQREPFGELLWVPSLILILIVFYQAMTVAGGAEVPVLALLSSASPSAVLMECSFIGFMLTTVVRTRF